MKVGDVHQRLFPDLFELWTSHGLEVLPGFGDRRSWFYKRLRKISIRGGEAVELEVPRFIRDLTR